MPYVNDVLVVGCGRIAGSIAGTGVNRSPVTHAEAIADNPEFSLTGAVDPNSGALMPFADQWDVPKTYANLEQAITERTWDIIVLAAPDNTHYTDLRACLDRAAAKLMIVEKPLCMNSFELNELEQLDEPSPIIVNHSRRFERGHREVARLIEAGTLGQLVSGSALYYGGWIHSGVHMVDTLRMFFGDAVKISGTHPGSTERPGDPTYGVDFSIGTAPIAMHGFDEAHFQIFELDLRFTKGRVRLNDFGDNIIIETVDTNAKGEHIPVPLMRFAPDRRPTAMEQLYTDAARILSGNLDTSLLTSDLPEACATMKLLFSIH